ncbi:MAG: hypothetical protein O2809_11165 [Proteobacteria bacterium]|nr:hypothetical protein [Pseudomonadota bacterium]
MNFSKDDVSKLLEKKDKLRQNKNNLMLKLPNPVSDEMNDMLNHGFLRRLNLLFVCIDNIYHICPPDNWIKIGEDEKRENMVINLQCFIINIFGALDNLAWLVYYQKSKSMDIKRLQVGIFKKDIKNKLSTELKTYLSELEKAWLDYLKGFRDSLAHRTPLYIPPNVITKEDKDKIEISNNMLNQNQPKPYNMYSSNEEYEEAISKFCGDFMRHINLQDNLGSFMPFMVSHFDKDPTKLQPIYFHAQVLNDIEVVINLSEKIFLEIS